MYYIFAHVTSNLMIIIVIVPNTRTFVANNIQYYSSLLSWGLLLVILGGCGLFPGVAQCKIGGARTLGMNKNKYLTDEETPLSPLTTTGDAKKSTMEV